MRRLQRPCTVAVLLVLIAAGCGEAERTKVVDGITMPADQALPPEITKAEFRSLRIGTPQRVIFKRFGKSAFAEGPSPATFYRCFTYRLPGTVRPDENYPDLVTYESWWLCFDKGKLVEKERQ